MEEKKMCRLICTDAGANLLPITLTNQQVVILGRCPATGILDKKLSRQQVEVKADIEGRVLHLKQLSSRPSLIAGTELQKEQKATIKHRDKFQLLTDRYEYQVLFPASQAQGDDPKPAGNGSSQSSKLDNKRSKGDITDFFKKKTGKRPMLEDETGAEASNHTAKKLKVDHDKKVTSKRNYQGTEDSKEPSPISNVKNSNPKNESRSNKATRQVKYHAAVRDSDDDDSSDNAHTSNVITTTDNKKDAKNASKHYISDSDDDGPSRVIVIPASKAKAQKLTSRKNYRGAVSDSSDDSDDDDDTASSSVKAKLLALQQNAKKYQEKRTARCPDPTVPNSAFPAKTTTTTSSSAGAGTQLGKPAIDSTWEDRGKLVVHTSRGVRASNKIVAFDLDGTIVTTKSGKVFATSADDWRIIYPEVPKKLKKLHSDGYKVVLFTNQLGIGKGKLKLEDFKRKLHDVQSKIGVPIQAFISTGEGPFRKPVTGMWTHLCNHGNDGIPVHKDLCQFIGDAAGRPADWVPGKKKDFSCSDRLFALNVGLVFCTPEEFFLGQKKSRFNLPEFDPRKLSSTAPLLTPPQARIPAQGHSQEVIVLVGFPASGKSSFVKRHLLPLKYVHINRDTMGSWQKCVAATESALVKGQSVVVDNTNPDPESRQRYTACAKKAGVHCRCFVLSVTFDHARHNEKFRRMTDSGKSHAAISEMIFHSYKKKYKEPTTAEGFDALIRVNFLPAFSSTKDESLYKMFLLDK